VVGPDDARVSVDSLGSQLLKRRRKSISARDWPAGGFMGNGGDGGSFAGRAGGPRATDRAGGGNRSKTADSIIVLGWPCGMAQTETFDPSATNTPFEPGVRTERAQQPFPCDRIPRWTTSKISHGLESVAKVTLDRASLDKRTFSGCADLGLHSFIPGTISIGTPDISLPQYRSPCRTLAP